MPALPLGDAGKYVAAAYIVFFALVLLYVLIMAVKLSRLERELSELNELADRRLGAPARAAGPGSAERFATERSPAERSSSDPSAPSAAPAAGGPG
jgi:CcmD family protein